MTQWRFAVPALVVVSLFSTVTARAASRTQPDDTRLPVAAQNGDQAEVQALLKAHVSVDSAEGDGSTALHWAAYQNNLALAQELLNAHANVNAVTRLESLTPLYMACESGSAPMVELLLKHGASVNQADGLGTTPLMMAAASGNAAVVKVLLDHGADVNAKEHAHDQTALMFAANLDRSDVIPVLLAHGADPNAISKVEPTHLPESGGDPEHKFQDVKSRTVPAATLIGGMTPLLFAARQGNVAAGEALVTGGANINEISGSEHTTPLVMAIMNGRFDFAKMLVEHGADVNLANDRGVTPLWATEDVQWPPHEWSPEPVVTQEKTNYLSLMKLLLAHGENPNARLTAIPWERVLSENHGWTNDAGATAFYRAAQAWDASAMKLLKDNGADPTIPTNIGTTPLMAAAGIGWAPSWTTTATDTQMAAIQYCVGLGLDVNAQDKLGYTALHGAAFEGDLPVIKYLIDHGADVKAKDKRGDTVADMANGPQQKSHPHPDAVALLVKLGSINNNNCRSSECLPPIQDAKKVAEEQEAFGGGNTPAADSTKSTADSAKPAADSAKPAADSTPTDVTLTTGKKPGK